MSKIVKKHMSYTMDLRPFAFDGKTEGPPTTSAFFDFAGSEEADGQKAGGPPAPSHAPAPAPPPPPPPPPPPQAPSETTLLEIQRKAYEEGFVQGERQGAKMGEEKLRVVVDRFEALVRELSGFKDKLFREAERDVLHLSLEIAKKIVRKAVRVDEEILQTLIRITLSKVARHSKVKIFLNPADQKILVQSGQSVEKYRSEFDSLELVADDKIEMGGCLVESNSGILDARIPEQFREVEREFLELMPKW